jgi:hypothetical protein
VDPRANAGCCPFARARNVQGADRQSAKPLLDSFFSVCVFNVANQQWSLVMSRAFDCPIRSLIAWRLFWSSVAVRRFPGSKHQRRVRIPDIPFRPLRPRHIRRVETAFSLRFLKRKFLWDQAGLTQAPRRTPSAYLQGAIPRRPQRRLVHSRLSARDYSGQPAHSDSLTHADESGIQESRKRWSRVSWRLM